MAARKQKTFLHGVLIGSGVVRTETQSTLVQVGIAIILFVISIMITMQAYNMNTKLIPRRSLSTRPFNKASMLRESTNSIFGTS